MEKIAIFGSTGMAGHVIYDYLKSFKKYKLYNVARNQYTQDTYILDIVYKTELNKYIKYLLGENVDYIINCIGMLIKTCEEHPGEAKYINSYFPHYLENEFYNKKTKIIHLSTDCVFSGKKGLYSETDITDGESIYAKTKTAGEIINNKDLTLRMSIIGKELKENGTGLFHWFMKQIGEVKGYTQALWSGMTTLELAKVIETIIRTKPKLSGLYQLAPDYSISKYDLLKLIQIIWKKHDVNIIPYEGKIINKILINNRKEEFEYKFPANYEAMLTDYYKYLKKQEK